jgi:DNA-binding transcriptional regulator YdaS (Cro superfamily)
MGWRRQLLPLTNKVGHANNSTMIAEAIAAAGGPTKLGRAVGVDHSTVLTWKRSGRIPANRVKGVAAASGIPPHKLRPDLFDPPPKPA